MERNTITKYQALVYDGPLAFDTYDVVLLTEQFALGKKYNSDTGRDEFEQIPVELRDDFSSWLYKKGVNSNNPSGVVPDEISDEFVEQVDNSWWEAVTLEVFVGPHCDLYVMAGNVVLEDDVDTDPTIQKEREKSSAEYYPWLLAEKDVVQYDKLVPNHTNDSVDAAVENKSVLAKEADYMVRFSGDYGGAVIDQEELLTMIEEEKVRWLFPIQ